MKKNDIFLKINEEKLNKVTGGIGTTGRPGKDVNLPALSGTLGGGPSSAPANGPIFLALAGLPLLAQTIPAANDDKF